MNDLKVKYKKLEVYRKKHKKLLEKLSGSLAEEHENKIIKEYIKNKKGKIKLELKEKEELFKNKKEEIKNLKELTEHVYNENIPQFFRMEFLEKFSIEDKEKELEVLQKDINNLNDKLKEVEKEEQNFNNGNYILKLGNANSYNNKVNIALGDKTTRWSPIFVELDYNTKNNTLFLNTPSGGWEENATLEKQLPGIKTQIDITDFLNQHLEMLQKYVQEFRQVEKEEQELRQEIDKLRYEIDLEEIQKTHSRLSDKEINKILDYVKETKNEIKIPYEYYENKNTIINQNKEIILEPIVSMTSNRFYGYLLDGIRYNNKEIEALKKELKKIFLQKQQKEELLKQIQNKINNEEQEGLNTTI